ncbi:Ryanodine receptor 3 (RYR-3) (RyR3) (Brain ryanodine receptor-calcium release channel) (Brain-type ryanodine receptor) (Type 3 ryanodine receptor) [Durusdinium trenchii]|uniref:Ryanodine receptor 3 (RYR-3) (RyR3) (Brain ryanodine receptor-calcium release channel) (Brain-type ryanodine receptor) (Type 3 ryanodine receptor) n=1 Tax=Durusdinium trenchii TaxID=1381693 RepID=A0ABP0PB55_9DINO
MKNALLIVNVQNDVVRGERAVAGGQEVVEAIRRVRRREFDVVAHCVDWHPVNHCSFCSNFPGAKFGEVQYLQHIGDTQTMKADVCVQGSRGADVPRELGVGPQDLWCQSGCHPRRDSHSAFKDFGALELSYLVDRLKKEEISNVFIAGVGTEKAIKFTALDAQAFLGQGVRVSILVDACCNISSEGGRRSEDLLEREHIQLITTDDPVVQRIQFKQPKSLLSATWVADDKTINMDAFFESVVQEPQAITHAHVRRVVELGKINEQSPWNRKTLLHLICELGLVELLKIVVLEASEKVNFHAQDASGVSSLLAALRCSFRRSRIGLVSMLLSHAPEAQRIGMIRCQEEELNLNSLMIAARDGEFHIVEQLLAHDSSLGHIGARSKFGMTALMFAATQDTQDHAAIVEILLTTVPEVEHRLMLIADRDIEGWSSLAFACKSGCFSRVDWNRVLQQSAPFDAKEFPINSKTEAGFTPLHLAAWNGKADVIRALADLFKADQEDLLSARGFDAAPPGAFLAINEPVLQTNDLELDLAIKRGHLECVRCLLRIGCHAETQADQMQVILHRLMLMGDVDSCEAVLNFADKNRIDVDEALVVLTKRIEAPETCTLSCADHKAAAQFLSRCEGCGLAVCLVCRDRCHAKCAAQIDPVLREHFPGAGWSPNRLSVALCECSQGKCASIAGVNAREKEAKTFDPQPLDTSVVEVDPNLERLTRRLARNVHNNWARDKILDNWTFAKSRDDAQKHHPLLLPFDDLEPSDQQYNMDMCSETIRLVLALGCEIERIAGGPGTERPASPSSPSLERRMNSSRFAEIQWSEELDECKPIDTSTVNLPVELGDLVECIAINSHEVWAREKIIQGWRYAPIRNIRKDLKLNPSLVPYESLSESEKHQLRSGAEQTIRAILFLGWGIRAVRPEDQQRFRGAHLGSEAAASARGKSFKQNKIALHNIKETQIRLFNAYLFGAARTGQLKSIDIVLCNTSHQVGADLDVRDSFGHTPLFVAAKRNHFRTAQRLMKLRVDVDTRDRNGLTPLGLAAFLGNYRMCRQLVEFGADMLVPDERGFTPLHHAASKGHVECCRFLTEQLQQEHQTNHIVNLNSISSNVWGRVSTNIPVRKKVFQVVQNVSPQKSRFISLESGAMNRDERRPSITTLARAKVQLKRLRLASSKTGRPAAKVAPLPPLLESSRGSTPEPETPVRPLSHFSPLSMAVENGNIDVVKLLISLGADPMAEDEVSVSVFSKQRRGKVTPYFRALNRHIRLGDIVEALKSEIKDRGMQESVHAIFGSNKLGNKITKLAGRQDSGLPRQELGDSRRPRLLRSVVSRRSSRMLLRLTAHGDGELDGEIRSTSTRELKLMLTAHEKEFADSSKMIQVLNRAPTVRMWRKIRAMRQFFREISLLLSLLLVFSAMSPLAWDYDLQGEHMWREEVFNHFAESLEDSISLQQFVDWILTKFVQEDLAAVGSDLVLLDYNEVRGGIIIEKHIHFTELSSYDPRQGKASDLAIPANVSFSVFPFLGDIDEMIQRFQQTASRWPEQGIRFVKIEVDVHNPFHDLYGIVQFEWGTSTFASARTNVAVRQFRLDYSRFPPSRQFQGVLIGMVVTFALAMIRQGIVARKFRKTPVVASILLLGLLVLDLLLFEATRGFLETGSSRFFNSWESLHQWLQIERRVIATFFFLSMIPLLKTARTIPSIGPVVVALLNTMTNLAVLIYLLVVAVSCFLLTLAYYVGFGGDVGAWNTSGSTFYNLFHTPFIETWDGVEQIAQTSYSGIVLASMYILLATITVNLLIAIVTDVYPKERKASDSLWETIITQGIEYRLRVTQHKRVLNNPNAVVNDWPDNELLRGTDGIRFERPAVSGEAEGRGTPNHTAEMKTVRAEVTLLHERLESLLQSGFTFAPPVSSKNLAKTDVQGARSPSSPLDHAKQFAAPRINEETDEELDIKSLLEHLLEEGGGSCMLQKVKLRSQQLGFVWDTVKQVRKTMGILQAKEEVIVDGVMQTVRFWRRATPQDMAALRSASPVHIAHSVKGSP